MSFSPIVVAVDASDASRRAAERGLELARTFDADLSLVHVYSPGPTDGLNALNAKNAGDANRRVADRAMQVLVAQLGSPEAAVSLELSQDVPTRIVDKARDLGASLVVVGTIGRTGVSRFFLGSVAERVLRRAGCPVWVERATGPVAAGVRRILVCTDFSANSEPGLALAAKLVDELEATVEVVHALEPTYHGLSIDAHREVVAGLDERLRELSAQHFPTKAPRVSVVEGANVVDALTAHASRTSPDLLVLATHGRTGLERVFMGSVAERVARFSPCSVLVARSRQ